MRKIGLIILGLGVAIFIISLTYAVEPVGTPKKMDGGAGNTWKKPEVDAERNFEVVPPGIDKNNIPGKGLHKGWEQGLHKGWDRQEADNVDDGEIEVDEAEALNKGLGKIKLAVEEYVSQLKNWLNARPNFRINQEGGISGYRQEIKSWLEKKPEAPDDIIKEITASF